MVFAWSARKNAQNRAKHGVAFEEAETAFRDEYGLLIKDPDSPSAEDRFILLGMSSRLRLLAVCHCYGENDETIRIISARKAHSAEHADYLSRCAN